MGVHLLHHRRVRPYAGLALRNACALTLLKRLPERQDVYCLPTKEGWLSVCGLVTSNCDEIRYACMSRPYVKQVTIKPEQKLLMVGPGNQVTLEDLWETKATRKSQRV